LCEANKATCEVVEVALAAQSDVAFNEKYANWVAEDAQVSVDLPALL